jgi:multidrug efflux system membrane fusion protein
MTTSPPEAEPLREDAAAAPGRSRLWIVLVLLAVAGVGGYLGYGRLRAAGSASNPGPGGKPGARPTPVVAARARRGDMNLYLTGLGTVTALNTVTIRSRVDGQIDKIGFTEGQLVHEGELLVEIDPRPFQVQLAQAEAQLAKDQALLKNARTDLDRYEQAKDAVSAQQLATQSATVNQYEASIRADQAQIDNARLQLTYSRITAPITGRIGLRLVDRGNMVRANDATGLAIIAQTQPISVVFSLPEDSLREVLPKVREGKTLTVEAYDRDLSRRLATGALLALDNQVDPATGTIRLKAQYPNEKESLYPNQFVNARLLTGTRQEAVIVPAAALQQSPSGPFVWIVRVEDSKEPKAPGNPQAAAPGFAGVVEKRDVKVGPSEGDDLVIESGVSPGELVVTDNVDKLDVDKQGRGTRVTARESGSSRTKGAP